MKRSLILVLASMAALATANAQPAISTASPLTAGANGAFYSQTFAATGGTAPYTWAVSAGILPPGLTLNASTGALGGTPTQTGRHYGFTIRVTDNASLTGSKAFDMHVYAKFTYGNPYTTPPNCTHTNAIYGTGDLNTCTVPGEVPLGNFSVPSVGGSFTDSTFGTRLTVVGANPSSTAYYDPSAFSATGKYAAIESNNQTTIINPATGAVIRANAPGYISNQTVEWDANDDDKYYWPDHQGRLNMARVSTGVTTVLIDFNTAINPATGTAFGLSWLDNGGTGDISKDNWMAMYSDQSTHLAIVVNLNNLHIYSADYTITRNGGVTPNWVQLSANGFVMMSRGVDAVSGKRYILVETNPAMVIYSMTGDPNNGLLTYERLGPEVPTNSFDKAIAGNDNNICEPNETCWIEGHGTTFEDSDGQQYYMWIDGQGLNYKASNDGESRGIEYARFNAGDLMLRSAAYEAGGGRTDAWLEYSVVQASDPYKDNHPGCAKHGPYCVVSQDPDNRTPGDLTHPYPHTAHDGNIAVIKGVGQEIRTLLYARTILWGGVLAKITNISNTTPVVVTTDAAAVQTVSEGMETCIINTGTAQDESISNRCYAAHILTGNTFQLVGTTAGGAPSSYTSICNDPGGQCGAKVRAGSITNITDVTNTNPVVVTTDVANPAVEGGTVCIYNTGLLIDVKRGDGSTGQCYTAHVINSTQFSFAAAPPGTVGSYTANCFGNPASSPCGAHMGVLDEYWPRPFASISGDGSRIIFNSNLGYYTADAADTVLTALTGFSPAPSEDLLTFTIGQSTGTNIPANTWVDITDTMTGQPPDYMTTYDKAFYVPNLHMVALLGSYRELSSEPNRSWQLYDPSENRMWMWSYNSTSHNEEAPEGGHPMGQVNIDPTISVAHGKCCDTGSQASENPRLGNYDYDFWGSVGRVTMPAHSLKYNNQLGTAAFDVFSGKMVSQGGGDFQGTSTYNPLTNDWSVAITTSGPGPNLSILDASFALNTNDKKIYYYGGSAGAPTVTLNGLFRFTTATSTWERLDTTQTCNISQRTGIAACPGQFTVSAATSANPAVITTSASNNYTSIGGYTTYATISGATGAWSILNGTKAITITNQGISFSIPVDTSALAQPPTGSIVVSVGRENAGWAYDENENLFLMFGGCDAYPNAGCPTFNDLWTYNPVANAWTELNPSCVSSQYCSGGQPINLAGNPPFERLAYIKELDAFWYMSQSGVPGSSKMRFWLYRYAPGAHIGTTARAHVYTIAQQAAEGRAAGSLNRNSNCTDPTVNCTAQSQAYGGAIASDGTKVYQIWSETSNNTGQNNFYAHPYVQTWSAGGGLVQLGTNAYALTNDPTGTITETIETSTAIVGTTPWVCYAAQGVSTNEYVACKGWDGAAWSIGGAIAPITGANKNSWPSITNNNGTPTVAYRERSNATIPESEYGYVQQWNGSSYTPLGGAINHAGVPNTQTNVDSISVTSDGTNPWAAWTEYTGTAQAEGLTFNAPQLYLSKWNGASWAPQCGGSGNIVGTSSAFWASVTYLGGKAYVAYTERTANTSTQNGMPHLRVRSCDGATWASVGGNFFLNRDQQWGWVYRPEITNDGTNIYVTWAEQGNQVPWIGQLAGMSSYNQHTRVFVSKWDGSSWTALGGALNVDTAYGSAVRPSIAIFNGNPVVQWGETTNTNLKQMYIKQWSGTDWNALSGSGLTITTNALPAWTIGGTYAQALAASGGVPPYVNWAITSGTLPTGLSLNSATGGISGVPGGSAGTYAFTVQVLDSAAIPATATSGTLSITTNAAPGISTASPLPSGTAGSGYAQTFSATAGTPGLTWGVTGGSVPAGLSLSSTGTLGGTPTQAGTFNFTVQVTDAASITDSKPYQLTVASLGSSPSMGISGAVSVSGKAAVK